MSAPRPIPTHRTASRLAMTLAIMALALESASLALMVPNSSVVTLEAMGFNGVGGAVLGAIYPVVGWLIASRRRENSIGWMFLLVGLSQAATSFTTQYAFYGLVIRPGSLPATDVAAWVGTWSWVPGFVLLFVIILLFPDGRVRSPRWRVVLLLAVVSGLLSAVPTAIAAWPYRGPILIGSVPQALESDPTVAAAELMGTIGSLLMVPVALASMASIVVRLRASNGAERQQLKWFAAAAVVEISFLVVATFTSLPYPFDVIAAALVVPLIPIATTMAILRYRLYEIDRIIGRTVSYALVTAVLAVVFLGLNLGFQTVLVNATGESTLAVAASTLVIAALFQPLRRRIQAPVDRRFNRARVDAEQVVAGFAAEARDEVDLKRLRAATTQAAVHAVAPSAAVVWLRGAP